MLTSLRSDADPRVPDGTGVAGPLADGAALVAKDVAHSWQNFAEGGFTKPQFGHPAESGVAHSMQNLAPSTFSVAQLGQITVAEE